ncbi:MAG: hypothetical protein KF887_09945 [Paracoccaceae bacterium]|nr:MAG: hypothetical protein KF887_09945 [Paracoccaceae bacterium]
MTPIETIVLTLSALHLADAWLERQRAAHETGRGALDCEARARHAVAAGLCYLCYAAAGYLPWAGGHLPA